MIVVGRRKTKEQKWIVIPHVPKTGGTFIFDKIKRSSRDLNSNLIMRHLRKQKHGSLYKNPLKRIYGPTVNYSDDKFEKRSLVVLRDAMSWYDSYYYYRKGFKKRHKQQSIFSPIPQPVFEPFFASGEEDYKKCLKNSFDAEYVEKMNGKFKVGFCPSEWMLKFDIGIYSAWLMFMFSDREKVWNLSENIRKDQAIDCKEILSSKNFKFTDVIMTSELNIQVPLYLRYHINPKFPFEEYFVGPKQNTCNYSESSVYCKDILEGDSNLYDNFLWKERIALAACNISNSKEWERV